MLIYGSNVDPCGVRDSSFPEFDSDFVGLNLLVTCFSPPRDLTGIKSLFDLQSDLARLNNPETQIQR